MANGLLLCPTCSGTLPFPLTSRVRLVNIYGRDIRLEEYWDETGVFHRHDLSATVNSYECSRGHAFTVAAKPPACPAGDDY